MKSARDMSSLDEPARKRSGSAGRARQLSAAKLRANTDKLMQAARFGEEDEVARLIPISDPMARDIDGWTPLMKAAEGGCLETMRLLMPHSDLRARLDADGVDQRAFSEGGRDALTIFLNSDNLRAPHGPTTRAVFDALVRGSDLKRASFGGLTALLSAARASNMNSADFAILAEGSDIEGVDCSGEGVLHYAAAAGRVESLAYFVPLAPRQLNVVSSGGLTPLMRAAECGQDAAVRMLLDAGAHPDIANPMGWTALMFAAREGQVEAAEILLPGAGLAMVNANGHTALDIARAWSGAVEARIVAEFERRELGTTAAALPARPRAVARL